MVIKMNEEKIIEMFHVMWDNFPTRARLIRKDRHVLAVNKIAAKEGFVTGVRCIDQPPVEAHRGCEANLALREHRGRLKYTEDETLIFWAPLEGCEDVYIHGSWNKNRNIPD
ncbi:hypothetical protein D7V94_18395 [Parablautia intestinalis]|jgi:hypothetical protein|uniref:Uncharacterized protein n=1 Tax=Parablautia intestinalis TaxID=2320100 RepID=A0A3A9APF5_9FIRM|nr:hypothetical protein [Parablautia intestinalis]MCI8616075.1 hypothetical protein [Lachnospiraceae bacterium]RKI89423.1 hypothetical protein D7V94_18395 [Parablautia intestinalis]